MREDETTEKYLYLLDPDRNPLEEPSLRCRRRNAGDFLMYSNYGHWQLVPTYAEDAEWISFWPAEGVGDARFSTLVKENKTAYRRYGELNVVVDGESVMVLKFNQEAAEPVLEIDMGEAGKTVSVKGDSLHGQRDGERRLGGRGWSIPRMRRG